MNVHRLLADMALELEDGRTPDTVIGRVSEYAVRLLDADDAGILVVRSRSDVNTAAATSKVVGEAHQLQVDFDEGPCLDAIKGKATYLTTNTADDPRWPQWGPAAWDIGVRSAVGVWMATRRRSYGSLNIYAERPGAFTSEHAELAEMIAAHATAAFAASEREEGLTKAVDSRTTIGQAQGILMQKFDIGADAAFDFLKRISQHENRRLFDVAEAIVVQRNSNSGERSDV